MKVLLAIDGSQHSAAALEEVASVATGVAADATSAVEIIRAGRQAVSVRR